MKLKEEISGEKEKRHLSAHRHEKANRGRQTETVSGAFQPGSPACMERHFLEEDLYFCAPLNGHLFGFVFNSLLKCLTKHIFLPFSLRIVAYK